MPFDFFDGNDEMQINADDIKKKNNVSAHLMDFAQVSGPNLVKVYGMMFLLRGKRNT